MKNEYINLPLPVRKICLFLLLSYFSSSSLKAVTAEFAVNAISVSQSQGSVSVPLKLTGSGVYMSWIDYKTSNGSALSGTHYTGVNAYKYIQVDSDKVIYISVPIKYTGDTLDRKFSLSLITTDSTSVDFGAITSVEITILGEPYHPPIEIYAVKSNYEVNQFAGAVRIPIKYTGDSLKSDVWVEYSTQEATAISGRDYTGKYGKKVHFENGLKTAYISVPIIYSGSYDDRAFSVVLSSSSEGEILSPSVVSVKILGEKKAPKIVFGNTTVRVGSFTLSGWVENLPKSAIKKIKLTIGGREMTTKGTKKWRSNLRASSSGNYPMALKVFLTNGKVIKSSTVLKVVE